jgi:hypothetical protein
MRRSILLVPVLLALTVGVAAADSVIGIGLAYGLASPTGGQWSDTKESKSGLNMAWRVPMALGKMFSLEPFMERTEGSADKVYAGTLDGYDVMSYGANIGLGRLVRNNGGLHLTPFVGGMLSKARRSGGPSDDAFAWQGGLSVGLHGSETTHWDIRGAYQSISKMDSQGETKARDYINVSLGLTCVVKPR